MLQHLIVGILKTNVSGYSGYRFPAHEEMKGPALSLLSALEGTLSEDDCIAKVHGLARVFLLAMPDMVYASKWEAPLEALIAVFALDRNANFKQPKEITQSFAMLTYNIRGCMLYEAYEFLAHFNGDLYK